MHAGDRAARGVGLQPFHIGAGQERDVRVLDRPVDADDLGVRLAVGQAGKTIKGVAAHAGAMGQGSPFLFIEQDRERLGIGMVADPGQLVVKLLDARLVADLRVRVGGAGPGLGRVRAAQAVDVEELLGAGVVGLKHIVAERPSRGDPFLVRQLAEVLLAEPIERAAIDLAVAADDVMQPRMEGVAGAVVPGVRRLILAVHEHGLGIPVVPLALQVVAALQDQDALAGRREL